MKKTIRLTEQQLNNVIKRTIEEEGDLANYSLFVEHWKNKFDKAIEILLKMGLNPEDLIKKIQAAYEKNA